MRKKCWCCSSCIVYVNVLKDGLFYVGFVLRKGDGKVKSFKYMLEIFWEVFLMLGFWGDVCWEREKKRKIVLGRGIEEKVCEGRVVSF